MLGDLSLSALHACACGKTTCSELLSLICKAGERADISAPFLLLWSCARLTGWLDRYEDNGDSVNNLNVLVKNVKETSITEYGDPKAFLDKINYLFGDQVFIGELLPLAVEQPPWTLCQAV